MSEIFQFYNFRLTDQGGCCIYYNEPQLLADIEEHLGVTIQQVGLDIKVCEKMSCEQYIIIFYPKICPALAANFLTLWVWEGTVAIQDDKCNYLEGITIIWKE